MRRNRSLALLAALLIGSAGSAQAGGQTSQFKQLDTDGDGVISMDEAEQAESEQLAEEFGEYDQDGDDNLDQGEFARFESAQGGQASMSGQASQSAQFEKIDKDNDGVITEDEAEEAKSEQLSDNFGDYDRDDDGNLDQGEFARFEGTQRISFDDYDADNDGKISTAEAEEYGPDVLSGNFEEFDHDENNSLDESEFANFKQAHAEEMEESARLEYYDTNNDGVVSLEEAKEGPDMLSENFEEYDNDGDGNLDQGEFARFEADHRAQEQGGMQKRQTDGM